VASCACAPLYYSSSHSTWRLYIQAGESNSSLAFVTLPSFTKAPQFFSKTPLAVWCLDFPERDLAQPMRSLHSHTSPGFSVPGPAMTLPLFQSPFEFCTRSSLRSHGPIEPLIQVTLLWFPSFHGWSAPFHQMRFLLALTSENPPASLLSTFL